MQFRCKGFRRIVSLFNIGFYAYKELDPCTGVERAGL